MIISQSAILKLSEMICGNESFKHFPYRSSSQLTKFFIDNDLEFIHDGSTRHMWVQTVLNTLNDKSSDDDNIPNKDLIKVLISLVNPDYFLFDDNLDHVKAVDDVNKALKSSKLVLKEKSDGQFFIVSTTGQFISTVISEVEAIKQITFSPAVFKIPNKTVNSKLISVMMPFNPAFKGTYDAIKRVADHLQLDCLRADDIWENSTIIQDIFDLIFCSKIVIVDFSDRNPNVMYETGIAHTLGKIVIPIAQNLGDIPSDLVHHRALKYLPNPDGYRELSNNLFKRIKSIIDDDQRVSHKK
ncbi:hypothetical protein ACFRAE_12950 [Sphingobacterium sp. HJSM2_6]|uniref:hypothetical protein n=1 Tax=Sphingobacterium sp. HJSM2_6 TaxID=3366264 RepID=UPI003BCB31FB